MKQLLISFFFFLIFTCSSISQEYQLLPDSCTFCFYSALSQGDYHTYHYGVYPDEDTVHNGESYMVIRDDYDFLAGVRQEDKKLYGFTSMHSSEELMMDWDALPGDTLFGLFSYGDNGTFYDAVVNEIDSVLLPSGAYHRYMTLNGFRYYDDISGNQYDQDWVLRWDEKALCGSNTPNYFFHDEFNRSGILFSFSSFMLFWEYEDPFTCTTDTLYDTFTGGDNGCENCIPEHPNASLNQERIQRFKVYPNPIDQGNSFSIESKMNKETTLVLTDINGRKLKTVLLPLDKGTHIIETNFSSGIYIVHFLVEDRIVQRQKLVVQ